VAKRLKAQGERSVVVGRDVINSIIVTGDHNQVFTGDYERLRDAYIGPWSVFERVNLDHFVGREWLLREVDAFLRDHDRGYFILEAEAGLGKTTFLAWLVREHGYIHHFTELAPGLDGVSRGLKNLAAQLVLAYHLSAWEAEGVIPGAAAQPDYLSSLLKLAADQRRDGEKIVLVVDALDEAGTPPGQNVLGLPQVLPEGVFLIVSQRPVPVSLHVEAASTPRRCFALAAGSDENQADMRRFLERVVTWPRVAQALGESGSSSEEFTTTLLEKCRGVWIYLHYVIHEIERGERSPLDLDALPDGMAQYYARNWKRWRDEDEDKWYGVYLPLLSMLAAAQEAVSAERLAEWADVKLPLPQVCRLLNERWRPFLALIGQGEHTRYRFYHATLRELFEGKVERDELTDPEVSLMDELVQATQNAHHRIVNHDLALWCGSKVDLSGLRQAVQDGKDEAYTYDVRHLTTHMEKAGRIEDLHSLLKAEMGKRNAWYEAKDAVNDITGYLNDVEQARLDAVASYNSVDSDRVGQIIGRQCRYALITTSLKSLTRFFPAALLVALVNEGVWEAERGLDYTRRLDPAKWAEALTGLLPHFQGGLQDQVLIAALKATQALIPEDLRVKALVRLAICLRKLEREQDEGGQRENGLGSSATRLLAPFLSWSLMQHTIAIVAKWDELCGWNRRWVEWDPLRREDVLVRLAPFMPESLLREAMTITSTWRPREQAEVLAALAPRLPEPLLQEALVRARQFPEKDEREKSPRAIALAALASRLPQSSREEALREALAAVDELLKIRFSGGQHWAMEMIELAPYLPESMRAKRLPQVLRAPIWDQRQRAIAMAKLVRCLPEPLKDKAVRRALHAARAPLTTSEDRRYTYNPRITTQARLALMLAESGYLKDAQAAAKEILDHPERYPGLLPELAPYLDEPEKSEVLQKALEKRRTIGDKDYQKAALKSLRHKPFLPRVKMLLAIKSTAVRSHVRLSRGCATGFLISHLPQIILKAYLKVRRVIGGRCGWGIAIHSLARYIPETLLREILEEVRTVENPWHRASALAGIAPRLAELGHIEESLETFRDIGDVFWQVRALICLSSHMPKSLKDDIVSEISSKELGYISSMESRKEIILSLAKLGYPAEALKMTWKFPFNDDRVDVLGELTLYLTQLPRDTLYSLWGDMLHTLSSETRPNFLADLRALGPVIFALGDEKALTETFRAIQDVGRWWP
jgi:hypothetical protein